MKYYLTAMLFIVFDIEIIFLYPWAVAFNALGMFGLIEMVLFIAHRLRRLRLRLASRRTRVGLMGGPSGLRWASKRRSPTGSC